MARLRSTSSRSRKSNPSSDWPRWRGRTPPRTRATSPCRASAERSLRTVTSETEKAFESSATCTDSRVSSIRRTSCIRSCCDRFATFGLIDRFAGLRFARTSARPRPYSRPLPIVNTFDSPFGSSDFERHRAVHVDSSRVGANPERTIRRRHGCLGPVQIAQRRRHSRASESRLGRSDPEGVHDQVARRRTAPAVAVRTALPRLRPGTDSVAKEPGPVRARSRHEIGAARLGEGVVDDVAEEWLGLQDLRMNVPARIRAPVDGEAQAALELPRIERFSRHGGMGKHRAVGQDNGDRAETLARHDPCAHGRRRRVPAYGRLNAAFKAVIAIELALGVPEGFKGIPNLRAQTPGPRRAAVVAEPARHVLEV